MQLLTISQRLARFGVWTVKQCSLFDNTIHLAGLMSAIKAEMRRIAGTSEGEGRKRLVDNINQMATQAQVRLTSGNNKSISIDTLDKWLSPSDTNHPPSILAVTVFCLATKDFSPIRVLARAVGCDLMTDEDRHFRDYGKASIEEKQARERKRMLEKVL